MAIGDDAYNACKEGNKRRIKFEIDARMSLFKSCVDNCSFAPNKMIGVACRIGCSGILLTPFSDELLEDCAPVSPLILDLDGDGAEASALTQFDHEGDGWSELSRWANEDDGMLVWDRNGDGKINDGSELFGNNTVIGDDGETAGHGFAALAELDSNDDGVVDSNGWRM